MTLKVNSQMNSQITTSATLFRIGGELCGIPVVAEVRATSVREAIALVRREAPEFAPKTAAPSYPIL